MPYECENCAMEFDTTAELANHKAKFCVHSKYGNNESLDKRMEELKRIEHDIDHYNYNINSFGMNLSYPFEEPFGKYFFRSNSKSWLILMVSTTLS